ncbi:MULTISPECIES: acyltransferase family protein [unclassified Microbacterium]|uniref:acyltransferase family protein n=1 Tax=unclassified Microbacterium TaxID=2609290 RepID=UPI00214B5181|nr:MULTISPECIES: acyltransferase family protein [unclassified Microbacterium]MCR2809463.1 acyltransferase [Microbacterium sp. zg.B185]WIM20597.1 acyltransferase family protein [Microbacterium sp. zg-B185]
MPSADHDLGPQHLADPSRPVRREPTDRSPEHAEPSRFLPHVQGLRAIAVLAVVLYHFWPARFSGGYVGVDIFFVISGFLITGHLMRELSATGTVRLGQFWARRARRLLPASLLVLLFCALVAMSPYLTPTSALPNEVREILASTFYVENWYLALNSADYLNHGGEPTSVQHYWSLSLEEQFYVMWPLIMLLAAWVAVKWFRGSRRRAVIIALAAVTVLSFAFCVVFTLTDPAPAYFVTFGRMWQFGIGAMVALVPALRIRNAVASFVLGWAGIAVLVFVIFRFDGQTPFPGYAAALPTLAAAAVIAATNTERWWYPTRLLALRPAQFVGDISYSLYLWHWPLIIIAPSVPFWGLTIYHRVALLGICFLLAWLTKRFVEDPARGWKVLTSRPARVTLWSSLAAMLVVAGAAGGAWAVNAPTYSEGVRAIQELRENPPACFGAAVGMDAVCGGADFGDTILPAPGFAGVDRPADEQCFVQLNNASPVSCEFGSDAPDAPRIALIGDSHAYQLLSTFQRMADENGWHLVTYFKGACPWNTAPLSTPGAFGAACTQWRDGVRAQLADRDLDAVFTAAIATTPYSSAGYDSAHDAAVAGYRDAWGEVLDRGIPVVTVVDNPVWETDPNKCLRTRSLSECDGPRAQLLVADDPLRDAAEGVPGVTLLDFTGVFCGEQLCSPVIGGANVYRDQDHLTVTFADTLAPWYTAALSDALGRGVPSAG